MDNLQIKPANLEQHAKNCIIFREDSFVVSFGDASKFHDHDNQGSQRYLDFLKNKISRDPNSVAHAWLGNQIVGQIELSQLKDDPLVGYVNLYYLIPDARNRGLGAQLEAYAVSYFKNMNLNVMRLSVSPTNAHAFSYYKKMGWLDLGPRPGHPEVHYMEKSI